MSKEDFKPNDCELLPIEIPLHLVDDLQDIVKLIGLPQWFMTNIALATGLLYWRKLHAESLQRENKKTDTPTAPDPDKEPSLAECETMIFDAVEIFTHQFLAGCPGPTIREVAELLKRLAGIEPATAQAFVADMLRWIPAQK